MAALAEQPRPTTRQAVTAARLKTADEQLGQRIRRERLRAGLSRTQAATNLSTNETMLANWELGRQRCHSSYLAGVALALGCPVASLLTDELVLQEIRVSDETLERVRLEGKPAAAEAARRIADRLEALLLAEATREPVDLAPYARPRQRRTRAQLLAAEERKRRGIEAAVAGRKARQARDDEERRIAGLD